MIVVMEKNATEEQVSHMMERVRQLGLKAHVIHGTERTVIGRLADAARERGVTVVMVTHSRSLAEAVADNLIEIEAGQVVTREGAEGGI